MSTVAEGFETEEQMARVVFDGCTDVQGYLISRPMRPEQISDFLLLQNNGVLRKASVVGPLPVTKKVQAMDFISANASTIRSIRQRSLLNAWLTLYTQMQRPP